MKRVFEWECMSVGIEVEMDPCFLPEIQRLLIQLMWCEALEMKSSLDGVNVADTPVSVMI
eukprot:8194048-Ditylum_brightwellii.AAC.1